MNRGGGALLAVAAVAGLLVVAAPAVRDPREVLKRVRGGATGKPPASDLDVEAYARCLASETRKQDAWPWIAVALRNAAAARKQSVADLLRKVKGVDVGWGHNYDGHFASTAKEPSKASLDFARRWVAGQIPDPPGSAGVRSFYEVNEHGSLHDPGPFLRKNPELQLAQEVDGWQFYRRAA
jgi:hypothetical protein